MTATPTLRGTGVTLRPVRDSDAAARVAAGRSDSYEDLMGIPRDPGPYGTGKAMRWVDSVRRGEPTSWVVDLGGRAVGNIRLDRHDEDSDGSCWLTVGLFDGASRSRGHGTDAVRTALSWAFSAGGRTSVMLRVREDNAQAIACYARCGFSECGRVRATIPQMVVMVARPAR